MKKTYFLGIICLIIIALSISVNATKFDLELVNQDPDPATAGEIVELRFSIDNLDTEYANDLKLEIKLSYPFSSVFGEEYVKDVGTLLGYQTGIESKILKYKVKVDEDAIADSYPLRIILYSEELDQYTEKEVLVDIDNKNNAEIIYIDTIEIQPGNTTSIEFTINNVGSSPLRNMIFSWENKDEVILPVGTSNQRFIKYLDVGEEYKIKYKVIADSSADPGLYKLDLTLEYDNTLTGETEQIITNAGLYVGGGTDFDVAFSEVESGEYSFTIANIGSNSANSVSVKVLEQQGWSFSGSNEDIIGNLNKGDYTIVTFEMSGAKSEVKLEIKYTDTKGERKKVEKTVNLNSGTSVSLNGSSNQIPQNGEFQRSKNGAMGSMGNGVSKLITWAKWFVIAVIIVIVGIVSYKIYKKKKMKNKDKNNKN